jgi:putative ABC transport system permease protein
MEMLARGRSLWRALRRRPALETEMDEEFRLHLELRAEDLVRAGLSSSAAARRARLEFGSVERYKEEGRESRGLRPVEELRGDVRYVWRSLRRNPGFVAAAVLMLGIGVGANSAVFSLVSASLLRPLPFAGADRLVVLHQTRIEPGGEERALRWSYPQFLALRASLTSFSHLAAYYVDDVNLSGAAGEPERVRAEMVSAAYFPALAVRPAVGRAFLPREDSVPGAYPVVVLGHDLWSRALGADSGVVGSQVLLNGVALTVVGVAPAGFRGLTGEAELWFPQAMAPVVSYPEQLTSPQHFQSVVGRLRPGVRLAQAAAEVETVGGLAAAAVRAEAAGGGSWGASLLSLEEARRDPGSVRARLVLGGAALFLLLIAVVNLSALLLARSVARARETAVRAALGAGRFRLVRQALVEGGLLGLLGGALGVLLALLSVGTLVALAPEHLGGAEPHFARLSSFAEPRVDWRVLAFAACVALGTGLLAGLIPALRSTRGDLTRALKTGARGSSVGVGSLRRPTVLSLAATLQVAGALVLLVGAALLLQTFHRLTSVDPGFQPEGLLTFRISPPVREYGGNAAAPLLARVLARVEAVPGVQSASVSMCTPFERCSSTPLYLEGAPDPQTPPIVGRHYVGPEHFRTLGIPLLHGRALTAADRAGAPRVAVINETAARRFWPGEDPLGRRVRFGGGGGFASPDSLTEIVGVVGDVLYAAPGGPVRPDFYTSYLQFTWPWSTVIVRAAGDPLALVPALRRAVAGVDPHLAIHELHTMHERQRRALAGERFATLSLTLFAGIGMLLAAFGIYGIMAYSVAQRRREMGIRLALGSTTGDILRVVVLQGAALAVAGLAIGTAVALVLAGALPALVAGVGTADPLVLAAVASILLLLALLACYLPARAATRVDPVETLAAD